MRSRNPPDLTARVARAGVLLLALAAASPGAAQNAAPDVAPGAGGLALSELEARRGAVEGDAGLPEDAKTRILELFTRAIGERRGAAAVEAETAALRSRIAQAPKRITEIRRQLERPATEPEGGSYEDVPLDELTAKGRKQQQSLEAAREELTAAEKALAALTALGPSLGDEIASRRKALSELRDGTGTAPADYGPAAAAAATAARDAYLAARAARLGAEIARAELQRSNYETLVRLATLERDLVALRVPRLDAEREALVSAIEAKRADAARTARKDAQVTEAAAAGLPPVVAALASDSAALREELESVTLAGAEIAEQLRIAERRVSELDADLVSTRERVQTVGPTEAIGRLLRRRLRALSGVEAERLRGLGHTGEIVRATDRRIDLGERRRDLADTRARVDELLAALSEAEAAVVDEALVRARASELVAGQRATVDDLHEAYGRYLTQLTSLDAVQRRLATMADGMREFIRRELLWIRSLPVLSPRDFAQTPAALEPLFEAANWNRALADAHAGSAERPERALFGVVVLALLLGIRPWARRRLAECSELTTRIRTDAFRHTAAALALTVLIAVAVPAIFAYAGWLLRSAPEAAPFSLHVADTLRELAKLLMIFSAARWLIHYNGLARRHFRWSEPVRVMLRREFRWLTAIALMCVVLGVYGFVEGTQETRLALGRPALMVFATALAVFFWRIYRADGALATDARRHRPDSLAVRTRSLWFPLLVAVPLGNVLAAAAGYLDAAATATGLLIDSGWLLLGVWVLRDTMMRWFTVAERRLRFERALRQRDEARAERAKHEVENGDAPGTESAEVEVPEVDFRELGEQGRAVVQFVVGIGVVLSLWAIWSSLLPALSGLERIQLPMTQVALVEGVEQSVAVTLTDVVVAALVLAATVFAARNLSGLLGFTLLRRVAGDAGVQYAIVTLCQYALIAAGVLYAFSTIGVQWSKLQWLVAALGVGLGFGLQEIVANFVSGIILLLERPIRVGDMVTVGDATGTVSRIRIRATTIVDWDRKELVVPNKEFVTGRLLNWTLSNKVIRLIVPVGVAYGSDVRRARELLMDAARETAHVLDDPKPIIVFNSFGDNALGLELRVYLPSMEHYLATQTALHDAVYEKFEQAGIVISFPQRDVHLDTSAPLDIRVHQAEDARRPARRHWRGRED
jgi:potassium efflux system protein